MLGTERVPDDALNIDQRVDNKDVFPEDERKQKHHRPTAVNFQVGFPTCFSGGASRASQWIFSKSMGNPGSSGPCLGQPDLQLGYQHKLGPMCDFVSLGKGLNSTGVINGLQVLIVVLCHEMG